MAITVYRILNDETLETEVPNGDAWHVDNHGILHVLRNEGGNVASFARGEWSSVRASGN